MGLKAAPPSLALRGIDMGEPDFLRKEVERETADEQAALYDEIYKEVEAEREAQDLPPAPIMVAAESGRRMRLELKK